MEETDDNNSESGENGLQQFGMMVEQFEEDPSLQLDLEDTPIPSETPQFVQMEETSQSVPELEAPPPPVVAANTPSTPILSTLKTKEIVQTIDDSEKVDDKVIKLDDKVIKLDDSSIEQMLNTQDSIVEDGINGGNTDSNQILEFGDQIMDTIASEEIQIKSQEADDADAKALAEAMEIEESVKEIADAVDEIVDESLKQIDQDEKVERVDEVVEDSATVEGEKVDREDGESKIEPDTEAVSEDEFPTEAATKVT